MTRPRLRAVPAAPSTGPVYLGYCRRSLDDKKQLGSIDRQRREISLWCERQGVDPALVEWVVEPDHTTRDDYAGHLEWHSRILPRAAAGVFVLVEERSLVGADIDYVVAVRDLTQRGAQLVIAPTDERPVWQGRWEDFPELMHGMKSKAEVVDTRARTLRGLREKVSKGYWVSKVPYGYFLQPDEATRTKDRVCSRLVVRPDEAAVVHRIAEMCIAGRGNIAVAKALKAEGIPGPGPKKKWEPDSVRGILTNQIYRGHVVHGAVKCIFEHRDGRKRHVRDVPGDPAHIMRQYRPELVIFDEETAAKIDAAMALRQAAAPGTIRAARHVVHPLSGWARCGKCGGAIAASSGAYCCDARRRANLCDVAVRVPLARVEAAIVEALAREVFGPAVREQIRAAILAAAEAARTAEAVAPAPIEREIASLRQQKQRAVRLAIATGGDEDVADQIRELAARITAAEGRLAAARQPPAGDEAVDGDFAGVALGHVAHLAVDE